MAITNLTVSNFKSFKQLDLALGRFNVVIGANASGKSNFVEIFRFLKSVEGNPIEDAISLRGGASSILNRRLGPSEPLQMRATSDRQTSGAGVWSGIRVHETVYGFCLQLGNAQDGILVKDDYFTQKLRIARNGKEVEATLDGSMSDGKRRLVVGPPDLVPSLSSDEDCQKEGSFLVFSLLLRSLVLSVEMWKRNALLIHHGVFSLMGLESPFGGVGVYDVDPRAVKRPHETAGIPRLEENGENLSLVLRQILADSEKSRMFHNLLRDLLPFAVEIGTEQYLGTSVLLKLREKYYDDALLADLLSDGTVDAAALITALYFEDKDVVIIEEPERNIHPHLISRLVAMMKDAARKKQIIVTTHSPEVVRHAGVENLLLVTRDKDGFSTISRPAEKEEVKIFLKNDLGLDELFIQDVLAM